MPSNGFPSRNSISLRLGFPLLIALTLLDWMLNLTVFHTVYLLQIVYIKIDNFETARRMNRAIRFIKTRMLFL